MQERDRGFVIAVVGAGPRGTSFLERLLARLERSGGIALRIVVLDPAEPGPGAIWAPEQSPLYLMNTPASFPTAAPVGATAETIPASSASCSFAQWRALHEPASGGEQDADFPARASYGRYLRWLHDEVIQRLEQIPGVRVEHRRTEVVRLARRPSGVALTQEDGGVLMADGVVLAVGHVPARLNDAARQIAGAAHDLGLHYVPPSIPTDVDYQALPSGENVLVRGMGLNFFDLMIQVTEGRGGRFRAVSAAESSARSSGDQETARAPRLEYIPSGREPRVIAGSRRGTPYRAKSTAPGYVPEGVELVHFTPAAVTDLQRRHRAVDFQAHLWPLILRDVTRTYYRTLVAERPDLFSGDFVDRLEYLLASDTSGEGVLLAHGQRLLAECAPDVLWFDIRSLGKPFSGLSFETSQSYQSHMLAYLDDDAETSLAGTSSPVKMAIGALHAARLRLKPMLAEGLVSQLSRITDVEGWFESLVEGTASGPPVQRIQELAALARAGVVEFLGPEAYFDIDPELGRFTAESPWAGGSPVAADVLVEAMMPANRVQLSRSPLITGLMEDGLARPLELLDAGGAPRSGKGFDVTGSPHRLIDMHGASVDDVFVLGLQLSSVQWGTAIAAEAGGPASSSARSLADADAAAEELLERARRIS